MPYIKQKQRDFARQQGFEDFVVWLGTVPIEQRKGFLAWAVMEMAKYSFKQNYFGRSTSTDAVRSALVELEKELLIYEYQKKQENGEV